MHAYLIWSLLLWLPAAAEANEWYLGSWELIEVKYPHISAMTDEEAATYIGRTIHYGKNSVNLIDHACSNPIYKTEVVTAGDFLTGSRFPLESLEIGGSSVELLKVECGSGGHAPGLSVIKKDAITGYISWDGAYFQITKR
ncbi:hypothetical protein [Halomonas sp. BC04]|uniref:hypothetical protein n=1 Tax=Halomonas sp. BC04 TaxID=1403540 RepID=UPI0012DF9981|nr:hypothetical protein [Halomonas sp. BC04]